MLSLAELRRAVRRLDAALSQARLQRVTQPDDYSVALTFYGAGEETHVLLCCRPGFARLSTIEDVPPAPARPPALTQYLRAHLHGVRCAGVQLLGEDRQAALCLDGPEGPFDLVLSLLGPRSNVYLLGTGGVVLASLRPLADTRRDLALGQAWTNPASAAPREGDDRWAGVEDEDYLVAIEATYGDLEAVSARDELLRQLGQTVRKELQFLQRREAKLTEDLASASAATGARRLGELLKGVLHTLPLGAARAVATDYATGEEVMIPLDPALSPAENLERLFARYQKAHRGAKALEQQLGDARGRREKVARLADDLHSLGSAPSLEELRDFAGRGPVKQLLARHYPRRARPGASPSGERGAKKAALPSALAKIPARLRPKVYLTEDGLEVWVGKTDEGNDYLTTRLARGNDLFFHLDGAAGSHVVLRTGGRKDPPSGSILDACELAVHFSKAREQDRGDVHVAAIKDVKKPRNAKPGLVHVLRGKTIHLRRDPSRLQRILGARPEE